ncbi:hypothetical protein F4782DRAFT_425474 [Xylaria castorea]|nr:hypothetical protein F4782DRAFT_425474 [Xylaria castorea]
MPILQRSCRACASAKRQCDLAVPRCGRCSSRGVTCKYINQPGAAAAAGGGGPNPRIPNRHHASDGEVEALDRALISPQSVAVEPRLQIYNPLRLQVIRTFDPTTVEGQINILQGFPLKYAWCGSNAFIHPYAYESHSPAPLSDVSSILGAICGSEVEHAHIPVSQILKFKVRHLLHLGARASSYTELVSCVQAIVLLHIFRLSHGDPEDDGLDHDNWAIWALTHKMWERAPTQLSSSLSPWRAWLFAESVRRTLLVCNILLSVYEVLKRGYAIRHLCIEALPFDLRTQLWKADTEESWRAAASYNGCAPPLVSFRQFKSLRKSCSPHSPFENLLCLSFRDLN